MSPSERSGYDRFADIYDEHWCAPAVHRFFPYIAKYLPDQPAYVLDLCCGTGRLVERMIQDGHNAWGLDFSEQMIRLALTNVPDGKFLVSDVRNFSLGLCFDVITCTFDSLNHLLTDEDLSRAFSCVKSHLKSEGVFIFDVNTSKKYETKWRGSFDVGGQLSVVTLYDESRKLATFLGTLQDGDQFELHQRPLEQDLVFKALEGVDLQVIKVEAANRDENGDALRERYVVQAQ